MESLKRALEQIGRMWANLTATQRVILSAAAAGMVVLLVFGSVSSTESWVRVAGPEVDPGSRAAILRKLQERNQKHEVRGAEILVPKQDADRIVLELAGEPAMNDDVIWKFLENSDPFVDRKQKDQRYQRALTQKLSAMIRSVGFIRNANVVITPGSESRALGFEGSSAKASVQVELQEGSKLSPKNVVAIANLVSKAVKDLNPDQVVITDNYLNSYSVPKSDGGAALAQIWRDYEREMEEDIQTRIKTAFRTASVVVRITAKNSKSKVESVKNSNPKVEEEIDRKSLKGSVPSGGSGLKGESVQPQPEGTRETDQELRTKNRFDVIKEEIENPAGKIEKISIAVLIPVEVGSDGKELVEAEKQLPKIREYVLAAADAPVNSVSVSFIPSKRPEPVAAVTEADRVAVWLSTNWLKLVVGAIALVGFFVLVRVIQANTAKDTVEELQALTTALTETQEARAELALPGEGDVTRLKQGIQDMVGRNPQGVATSLKSFMSGR